MALKRNLMGQLLLHVTVGFALLYTKDLQVKAQSELPTPSQQPPSLDMTTASTITTLPLPTTQSPQPSFGKFISFSSICHSDITLEVRTTVSFEFPYS